MSRKPTAKGRAYMEETKRKSCKSLASRIQKTQEKIVANSQQFDNVHLVQSDIEDIYQLGDELQEQYELWISCLDDEVDLRHAHRWYDQQRHSLQVFAAGMKDWISIAKEHIESQLQTPSEQASLCTSHRSSKSAVRVKLAELMTQSTMLEEKQALRNQLERLEIEEKIAIAKAQERALEEPEGQSNSISKTVPACLPSQTKENYDNKDTNSVGARTFPGYYNPQDREQNYFMKASVTRKREEQPATPLRPTPRTPKWSPMSSIATIRNSYRYHRHTEYEESPTTPLRVSETYRHPRDYDDDIKPPRPARAIDDYRHTMATEFPPRESLPQVSQHCKSELPSVQEPPASVHHLEAARNEVTIATFLDRQNRLTEILSEQHQRSLLPPLVLSSFSNDPVDFITFISNFESHIETKVQTNEVRLRYLEQYLEGEAKDLIKGCKFKEPELGYPEAKKLLKDKYGDPYKVANAYIKKAADWPIVNAGNDAELDNFSTFLTQCVSAMESISYLHILDHPQNLQNLVKKLPLYIQDRWRRKVINIRESQDQLPGFKALQTS